MDEADGLPAVASAKTLGSALHLNRHRLLLLLSVLLPAACGGDRTPAGMPLRPGDSLLDVIGAARLVDDPGSLLPESLAPWRERSTGTGVWVVPATRWRAGRQLTANEARVLGLERGATLWGTGALSAPDIPMGAARVWHEGELLTPHDWPEASGLPRDGTSLKDSSGQLVLSWEERKRALRVVSMTRPGALRVEYPLDPAAVLAAADPRRPDELAGWIERASFGRVERRALRLPGTGAVEWDLADVPSAVLEVHVAVSDEGWALRDGFLMRAPGRGDGVTFAVDVVHDGLATRAWSRHLKAGDGWQRAEVDLSPWLGQQITLRLVSDSGPAGDASFDAAFWAGLRLRGQVETPPRRPTLVLVDLDTLRADRLGVMGHSRDTSPRLDAWVASSGATVYADCMATSSWTLPSTMSMLTGLHVFQHGVNDASHALPDTVPTLAELLSAAGYETAAWVEGGFVSARHGFGRGFDSYDASVERDPDWSRALDWMAERRSEQPAFVFLQTYMVHAPYPHDERYWARAPGDELPLNGAGVTSGGVFVPFRLGALALDARERDYVDRLYDAGVHRMDEMLGDFLEQLDERLGLENTLVVITSDHGEELFEHGGLDHGRTLYEEVLRVPLIVRWPDGEAPRGEAPRTLLDIAPTLLHHAGVAAPESWLGSNLRDEPSRASLRVAQLGSWGMAVRRGDLKLIDLAGSPEAGRSTTAQLFDLSADAREENDLAATRIAEVAKLRAAWAEFKARHALPDVSADQAAPMDSETRRALQELGYIDER
jgi:arylsulfatase A-like enzyme